MRIVIFELKAEFVTIKRGMLGVNFIGPLHFITAIFWGSTVAVSTAILSWILFEVEFDGKLAVWYKKFLQKTFVVSLLVEATSSSSFRCLELMISGRR